MESKIKILNAEKKDRSIKIEWSDGNISDYNFLWLRDNCPSEIHPTARERTFNLLTVSESIHPKSFTISEDNSLSIIKEYALIDKRINFINRFMTKKTNIC